MNFSDRMQDLKQRGVFRVGAVYLAAAFALIQGVDIIFPRLGLPDWTVTAVIVLAILGFPMALALAWAFDVKRSTPAVTSVKPVARRVPFAALLVISLPLMVLGAWYALSRDSDGDLDANLVAVLPFRVAGAAPELSYLREGMVDLLAAKLGGTTGVRSVESRTVLAAWRKAVPSEQTDLVVDDAIDVGRAVHAGHLLLGEIVGTSQRLIVTAQLVAVRSGHITRATVEGPADSLPRVVDRLAAELLAVSSGVEAHRLETLVGTSLPALREYLEGRQAYRRGLYNDAVARFQAALKHDSTFALAAYGLARSAAWTDLPGQELGNRIAWQHQDRLPARDRELFRGTVSPRYPAVATGREWIAGGRHAVRVAPDDAEAWFELGDALYHYGRVTAEERPLERARDAFERALELDPSFAPPLEHAIEVASMQGDTAAVRRMADTSLQRDSIGETAQLIRWLRAATLNDERTLAQIWQRIDSVPPVVTLWLIHLSQDRQLRVRDFSRHGDALSKLPFEYAFDYIINAGQPQRALKAAAAAKTSADPGPFLLQAVLYGGMDSSSVSDVVASAEAKHVGEFPRDSASRPGALRRTCTLEEYRAIRGDFRTVNRSIAALRGVKQPEFPVQAVDYAHACATMLDAIVAVETRRADADQAVQRLQALSLEGINYGPVRFQGNLVLARLLEKRGDREGALAALRRRSRVGLYGARYLTTYLREEGRLAALTGDRDGAIRAYQHYLAIRNDAEPSLQPEVEAVRRQLAALGADPPPARR